MDKFYNIEYVRSEENHKELAMLLGVPLSIIFIIMLILAAFAPPCHHGSCNEAAKRKGVVGKRQNRT